MLYVTLNGSMAQFIFLKKLSRPIERFIHLEASSGILLFLACVAALICANTSLWSGYESLINLSTSIQFGSFTLHLTLQEFVNDVLMTIFFFVVGLEIKRELVVGSLSTRKQAFLPIIAAVGGMIVPASIFIFMNFSEESIVGWGIPMATDIAFALGVLTFLSKRVPMVLKIFLLALATIDDLGAIAVIAVAYSSNISGLWLSLAGGVIFTIFCFRKLQIQSFTLYLALGVLMWLFIHESGIHATIAGVILGLLTPVKSLKPKEDFNKDQLVEDKDLNTYELEKMKKEIQLFQSPAQVLIDHLHLWVSLLIMPLFAFFNSGIHFGSQFSFYDMAMAPITQGVFLGLVIGKPLGVFLTSWLAVKLKWAVWPTGVRPIHILGIGFLAGIGFTMAFFICNLSVGSNEQWDMYSKVGVLFSSVLAGILGYIVLYYCGNNRKITS